MIRRREGECHFIVVNINKEILYSPLSLSLAGSMKKDMPFHSGLFLAFLQFIAEQKSRESFLSQAGLGVFILKKKVVVKSVVCRSETKVLMLSYGLSVKIPVSSAVALFTLPSL